MKRILALSLALLLTFAAFAGCSGASDNSAGTPASGGTAAAGDSGNAASGDKIIKLGVFESLSGDNGAGGKQETLGWVYANSVQPTIVIGGETYTIVLETVDNESSTDKAPSAAQSLVSRGVSAVLGSYGSAVCIASSAVFDQAGLPMLTVSATNPQVTADNDNVFRLCFLDPFQGTVLADYAYNTLGATNAYVLSKQGDDYSAGLANYFVKHFEELGGKVTDEQFPQGNTDFSSYVANAKAAGAQVFFSPVSTEAASNIIDQANAQALGIPILAGDTWDSNVITQAGKGKDIEVTIDTFYQESGTPFDVAFKEWISADPQRLADNNGDDTLAAFSVMAYDGYFTMLEAIKAADSTDSAAIQAALSGVKYDGQTGAIAFDDTGDALRNSAYIKKVNTTDGTWEFLEVATVG
ncbi:MAG: ABC transporter substrate-binding protein [Oscillospiraceae bacterium]|jgi:branched-chain amino acid transport system substrate-binding protein|nr:ABC transporter substrate-binding protein [Oscillospiraceae bacterium]